MNIIKIMVKTKEEAMKILADYAYKTDCKDLIRAFSELSNYNDIINVSYIVHDGHLIGEAGPDLVKSGAFPVIHKTGLEPIDVYIDMDGSATRS